MERRGCRELPDWLFDGVMEGKSFEFETACRRCHKWLPMCVCAPTQELDGVSFCLLEQLQLNLYTSSSRATE
jgi:hypothetical protein